MNLPDLKQLTERGLINPVVAQLLNASVHSGMNLVISGRSGTGRTTLLRALGRAVPAHNRIVTLEVAPQLNLAGPGRQVIEMTGPSATDLMPIALRHNVHRILVDESGPDSAVPLLQAMASGDAGSMCTLTATNPRDALNQLIDHCAAEIGNPEAATYLVGQAIDLIIQLESHGRPGDERRFVSHISEAHPREDSITLQQVFAPVPGQPRAVFQNRPARIQDLEHASFDHTWLTDATRTWGHR
ncbi:ATPase, T2SS/T4P/T4SS family [Streptomyces sp. NPDC002133]|uniref:ATPase, T2SS/T4P/T4SS family n=1 Tax=Streptomyces sp. NPDC002133 TaxID=3154409 RepID=UPI00332CECBC